jgi:hypothetical protein
MNEYKKCYDPLKTQRNIMLGCKNVLKNLVPIEHDFSMEFPGTYILFVQLMKVTAMEFGEKFKKISVDILSWNVSCNKIMYQ